MKIKGIKGYKILIAFSVIILFFQIRKRNAQLVLIENHRDAIAKANSPYVKLLNQFPVYRDSIFSIYISKIEDKNKIIFVAKDSLTEVQKESDFFVHIYPKNKNLLKNNINHLAFNFKNNTSSFVFWENKYFYAETNLPNFTIEKINLGQYNYRGNNLINWNISNILRDDSIAKIIKENNEKVEVFENIEESY